MEVVEVDGAGGSVSADQAEPKQASPVRARPFGHFRVVCVMYTCNRYQVCRSVNSVIKPANKYPRVG